MKRSEKTALDAPQKRIEELEKESAALRQTQAVLEQNLKEITFLNELGKKVSSNLSFGEVVNTAIQGIFNLIEPDLALFFLKNGDDLTLLAEKAADPAFSHRIDSRHKVGECLCGIAVAEERPIYAVNIHQDPRCTWQECKKAGLVSFAALPLKSGNDIIGLVGIAASRQRDFRERSTLLETASSQIAVALQNALYYSRLREHADQLEKEVRDRKQAQESLKESEERFRQIYEHMTIGIARIALDFTVESANNAYCRMIGYTEAELKGRRLSDISHPETYAENRRQQEKLASGEIDHYRMEKQFIHKNGKTVYGILDANLVRHSDGTPLYFIGSVLDVTQHKTMEKQLRQSQKMEAIGTLAGGIAHDFNNILSSILGSSQLAEMTLTDPGKAKKHIGNIVKAVKRAADLVQQILTFSRKTEYEKKPLRLYIELKEAVKLLRSTIPTTIEIEEHITSRAAVMADPTQMHQVIMNLCTNAYHAMSDTGGTLTVKLEEIDGPALQKELGVNIPLGRHVRLEVADTGHGMDDRTLGKAFEPYFTTKEREKGTGLGLALVQAIVAEHGGYIRARSSPGKGAAFSVYLPVRAETREKTPPEPGENILPVGSETVLMAEDEADIRFTASAFLEKCGYTVVACENGEQALEAFKKNPGRFDVVVTDMTMPKMTGFDLALNLLDIRPGLPVILCTGYSEKCSREEAAEAGIACYLQKPVTGRQIAALIRETMDSA